MTSAYAVEMSVIPGGARRGEIFVCSTFAHIRQILMWEFAGDPLQAALAADLAVFYGETIGVWTIEAGKAVAFVDLHPFLRVRVDGGPPVRLDDTSAMKALPQPRQDFVKKAEFDIHWTGIEAALPQLTHGVAQPGDTIEITEVSVRVETYLEPGEVLAWGWNDLEGGEEADDTFPVLR